MKTFDELIKSERDTLTQCVHCGLCLDECPTYKLSGDENNSPRGRLFSWRDMTEGTTRPNTSTDHYTDECLGCLACESACPANVPYGDLLAAARKEQAKHKAPHWRLRLAAHFLKPGGAFQLLTWPLRVLRHSGQHLHPLLPPGCPEINQTTAEYADQARRLFKPNGPRVALFTGCLMEGVYREINFATMRILMANNFDVIVSTRQECCGALHEHEGLQGKDALDAANRAAFARDDIEHIIVNSSGCSLSLTKTLGDRVVELGGLLNACATLRRGRPLSEARLYWDAPCHLYHGMRVTTPPSRVFEAIATPWQTAPGSDQCCGAGGAYNMTHEKNSNNILKEKAAFLAEAAKEGDIAVVTSNHVCLGQWASASAKGYAPKNVRYLHIAQALDESYRKAGLYL